MKIKHNGIEVSTERDAQLVRQYQGGLILGVVLAISVLSLAFIFHISVSNNVFEFNKDDLGELIGAFDLGIDLDALSWAVAMHETGNCRKKSNFSDVNNCHGIKIRGGVTSFPAWINDQRWKTSDDYFKDLWRRKYAGEITYDKAFTYSGNDRAEAWYNNVKHFYAEAKKTKLNF